MKITHAFAGAACMLGLVGTAAAQWGSPAGYGGAPAANVSPAQYTPGAYVPSASYPQAGAFVQPVSYPSTGAPASYPAHLAQSPTIAPPRGTMSGPSAPQFSLPTPAGAPPYSNGPGYSTSPSYAPSSSYGAPPSYSSGGAYSGSPPYSNAPYATPAPSSAPYSPSTPYAQPVAPPVPQTNTLPAPTPYNPSQTSPYSQPMTTPAPYPTQPMPTPGPGYAPGAYGMGAGPSPVVPTGPGAMVDPGLGSPSPINYNSPYDAALNGCDGGCGVDGCGVDSCGGRCGRRGAWFASLAGLLMTRDRPNGFRTTGLTTDPDANILQTNDARMDWVGGYEVRLGRAFGECMAVEATYWSLARANDAWSVFSPTNSLQSTLTLDAMTAGGVPLTTIFNNSGEHQVARNDEFHNLEINVMQQALTNPCSRFGITAIAGARYFRMDEGVTFGAAAAGTTLNDTATSAYYDVDVVNDLIGGQIGARTHYQTGKFRLYAIPKVGVYCNSMRSQSQIFLGTGASGLDVTSYKQDVSMIGQLDVGTSWQVLPRVSLFLAYRGLGVTGLALSDNQFENDVTNTPAVQQLDSNGSMILHGAVSGVQLSF